VAGDEKAQAFALIRQWGDPVLRERAREVEEFDDAFAQQVSELDMIMRGADDAPARVIVNPRIVTSGEQTDVALEGCLSLGKAGVHVEVERPTEIVVEAVDAQGNPQRIEAAGLHARILQHENDHLDGVLMLDRTVKEQKREAIRALNNGERYRPPSAEADE
jgi:peptide deformylase